MAKRSRPDLIKIPEQEPALRNGHIIATSQNGSLNSLRSGLHRTHNGAAITVLHHDPITGTRLQLLNHNEAATWAYLNHSLLASVASKDGLLRYSHAFRRLHTVLHLSVNDAQTSIRVTPLMESNTWWFAPVTVNRFWALFKVLISQKFAWNVTLRRAFGSFWAQPCQVCGLLVQANMLLPMHCK